MTRDDISTFFVNRASISLGKMLDHAVYTLHMNAEAFFALFISTGLAAEFERRDLLVLAGKSGIELVYEVMDRCGLAYERVAPRRTTGKSKEYHAGYALARFQADSGLTYREITDVMSLTDIIGLYEAFHDKAVNELPWQLAGEERRAALDEIEASFPAELRKEFEKVSSTQPAVPATKETHLKEMRLRNGISQSQLAAASGVPVRTIQQYEQRQKNINKAQFEYIIKLSRVLNCAPEQLLEK